MSQSGEIYVFSATSTKALLNLSLAGQLDRTVDVYLNNKLVGNYKPYTSVLEPVILNKGENKLEFHSRENCVRPYNYSTKSEDIRCISVGLTNLDFVNESFIDGTKKVYFGNNWYPEEESDNETHRWMSQDATIFLSTKSNKSRLIASISSFNHPQFLDIYLNSELIDSYKLSVFTRTIITPELFLSNDTNILLLHSRDGCDIPNKFDDSSDLRCLSFTVNNITMLTKKDLEKKNITNFLSSQMQKLKLPSST